MTHQACYVNYKESFDVLLLKIYCVITELSLVSLERYIKVRQFGGKEGSS